MEGGHKVECVTEMMHLFAAGQQRKVNVSRLNTRQQAKKGLCSELQQSVHSVFRNIDTGGTECDYQLLLVNPQIQFLDRVVDVLVVESVLTKNAVGEFLLCVSIRALHHSRLIGAATVVLSSACVVSQGQSHSNSLHCSFQS